MFITTTSVDRANTTDRHPLASKFQRTALEKHAALANNQLGFQDHLSVSEVFFLFDALEQYFHRQPSAKHRRCSQLIQAPKYP